MKSRTNRMRFWAASALLAGGLACCGANFVLGASPNAPQDQTPPQTPGAIRVATNLISLNVIVRDKRGAPVTDLTKDDFVVIDGKKERPIQIFSVVKASAEPESENATKVPENTFSNSIGPGAGAASNLTIILLDSLNTSFFDRSYPKAQVRKLLLTLQPQDRVALYVLGARLRILHDFTSDASALLAALKNNPEGSLQDVDVPVSQQTNAYNTQMMPLADESVQNQQAQMAPNRSALTSAALRAIANHVSYLPGRKNLIWVSDDFPFYLEVNNLERGLDGKRQAFAGDNELVARALENAQIAVYPVDARGLETGGISEIANESVDKKIAEMDRDANMKMLAERTGGREYHDSNGILGSIRQTIDGSRVTYELGFYPEGVTWDGSFHKLQVKVKRKDMQVQARDGYFALAAPSLSPEIVHEMISQSARSMMDATGVRFDVHVEPAATADATEKLNLSFSIDPGQFAFQSKGGGMEDSLDMALIALDGNERIIQKAFLPLPFKLDAATYERVIKMPLTFTREWAVPPGATELRVILYDEGNSAVGSVRVPLAAYVTKN